MAFSACLSEIIESRKNTEQFFQGPRKMIYAVVLVPLLFLALLGLFTGVKKEQLNKLAPLFIVALVVIAGVRDGTGTDTRNYEAMWRDMPSLDQSLVGWSFQWAHIELGFRLYMSILKTVTDSSVVFLLATAMLGLGFLYAGLRKISPLNIYLAIALYLMVFYMPYTLNAMRQSVAMGIFIYSIPYILGGNFRRSFLLSILAASMHVVGLLIMAAFFVARMRINLLIFVASGILVSVFLSISGLPEVVLNYIAPGYYSRNSMTWGSVTISQIISRSLLLSVLLFAALYVVRERWFSTLVMVYSLGFFIYISLTEAAMMAARFNLFFRLLEIILFSFVVASSRRFCNRLLYFILALGLGLYSYFLNLGIEANVYHSVFHGGGL